MPLSRIRVLPIWTWSPSRILGTPVMSAALAAAGNSRMAMAGRNFINIQNGRISMGNRSDKPADCGADWAGAPAPGTPSAVNLTRRDLSLLPSLREAAGRGRGWGGSAAYTDAD